MAAASIVFPPSGPGAAVVTASSSTFSAVRASPSLAWARKARAEGRPPRVLAQAALRVAQRALQHLFELGLVERLQDDDPRARKERSVHLERRVLGGGADENDVARLDVSEKGVLLALVEAMNLVDEQDRALALAAPALFGRLQHLADVLDARQHRAHGFEMGPGQAADDVSERRLAGARRAPEDEGPELILLDRTSQGRARAEGFVLAEDLVEGAGTHAIGQGSIGARLGGPLVSRGQSVVGGEERSRSGVGRARHGLRGRAHHTAGLGRFYQRAPLSSRLGHVPGANYDPRGRQHMRMAMTLGLTLLGGEVALAGGFSDPERAAKLAAAFPDIDAVFRAHAERARLPGLAYGVIVDGQLVHQGALGLRDVESKAPATPSSVFRIASMTKSFTALAVLKLRDQGRLSLDDEVARYVPAIAGVALPTKDSPALTIRHLLTHAAGFPEDNPWGDRQLAVSDATMAAWMRRGLPFSNAPGVAFEYSNYGFAILGQVVARASGMRYRDYVDRNILAPLGMTATVWEAAAVPKDRLASGHHFEGDRWVPEPALPDGAFGAMGGLYSSVPDLARYVAYFLSAWPPRDEPETGPVRRASVREMQQAQRATAAAATRATVEAPLILSVSGYGYGLGIGSTCRFKSLVGHSGGLPGYGSQMRWLPEHGVGIVALSNRTYASLGPALNEALAALDRTGALQPRLVPPSAALVSAREGVDRLLAAWDDGLADALAADNLYLDRSRDRRRRELEDLAKRHGACKPAGELEAENALRGSWPLACQRGTVRFTLTLAPTMPPRIQHLEAASALPISPRLASAAGRLAAAIADSPDAPSELLAPGAEGAASSGTLTAAAAWGRCRVGDVQSGDGEKEATVRFRCDKGELDASVTLSDDGQRLKSFRLSPVTGQACVP